MTTAAPPPVLLDLTRLVSRLGLGPPTGIDRVERAWLDGLMTRGGALFGLVRTAAGYCLLDRDGIARVAAGADAAGLPRADLLARLTRRGDDRRARCDTVARAVARHRCLAPGLAAMLRRRLPPGLCYINVGHANLTPRVMAATAAAGAFRAVLVHDVIPLDHPALARPDMVAAFAARMRAVAAAADLVIYNSADTQTRAEARLAGFGRVPPGVVSHLGHAPVTPDPAALPAGIDPARPLFLTLGTIEPRKNHALLLDVWERLAARRGAAGMPLLAIVGRRGWNNAAVFDRLDRLRHDGAAVREIAGLPDGGVAALMARARALLFPSRAEGFGLPLVEAMAAGLPALCAPLPVFAEIAGDYPVYLEADDVYSWTDTIDRMSSGGGQGILMAPDRRAVPHIVSWDEHINRALGAMG